MNSQTGNGQQDNSKSGPQQGWSNDAEAIDQILLSEEQLLPSSGFAVSVMDEIFAQAAAPAPIPFPWKLALPGIAALVAGVIVLCQLVLLTLRSMSGGTAGPATILLNADSLPTALLHNPAALVLAALAGSWGCVALCRRLPGSRPV